MDTGRPITTLDTIDGVESMYLDTKLHRLYLTALDGYLQVIQQVDADQLLKRSLDSSLPVTMAGIPAGLSPISNLLCVAVPPVEGQAAEICAFSTEALTLRGSDA